LRRTARRRKDGEVGYLQLAHNEWDPVELIADVLDGVKFKDGVKVTDDEATTQDEKVAA